MQVLYQILKIAIITLSILAFSTSNGKTIEGKVISVADGDTLTILDIKNTQHKIRLVGIDAPERRQSYGDKSRAHLASLVDQKIVRVEYSGVDRYQRTLGKVFLADFDINLEQVSSGFAWHYKLYEKEQSTDDRNEYSKAEALARESRKGLWQEEVPLPPWEFRRAKTTKSSPSKKTTNQGPVKLSKNGICHKPSTSYYERTKHFTLFKTLEACISSGGRIPQ